jgi:hypothetical protein
MMHQPVDELPDNPSIKFVRLNTGEDLVTEIVEVKDDKDEYFLFVNPLKIVYVTGQKQGSIMLSFIEWVFPKICSKQQFKIYPNDILTIAEVTDKMEDYYYETIIKLDKYVTEVDDGIDFDSDYSGEESKGEITEEELEYLNKIIGDLKDAKGKLH